MSLMLSSDDDLLAVMAQVYERRGESVTYRRHTGTIREGGVNVDQYEEFSIMVLTGQRKRYSTKSSGADGSSYGALTRRVEVETLNRACIFRVTDLPDGVDFEALTQNDRAIYQGKEMAVINCSYSPPFIRFEVVGY